MDSNFGVYAEKIPILANIGKQAENNLYIDPNTTLTKMRLFCEKLVEFIFFEEGLEKPYNDSLNDRLKILKFQSILPDDEISFLHKIKNLGNKAVHEGYSDLESALLSVQLAYRITKHIAYSYLKIDITRKEFIDPKSLAKSNIKNVENEYKGLESKFKAIIIKKKKIDEKEISLIRNRSIEALKKIPRTEAETRLLIDEQLREAGWEVDSENIKYSKGTRPEKNKNKAIAEYPIKGQNHCDYALFAGLKFIGIIEAKKFEKDVLSDLTQSKRYSIDISSNTEYEIVNNWNSEYKVPFLFSANGRPYLKQLEEKSGVWFLDCRDETNHPRALHSWYSPEGLMKLLQKNINEANKKLLTEPFDYLTDKNGLGLRYYQVEAIKKAEEHIANGNRKALIAMATGTGKTRTTIGLVYRLIKNKRFDRILFLVDRNALGDQASDAFKDVTIDELLTFNKIFDIKELENKKPDINTKVHFATVQGLLQRIFYSNDDDILTTDTYDCIIIDEAHRGYFLDKELSEEEQLYKNQWDYISKYRRVIDYFDAVKIGLTATPALHTKDIFGETVYSYSYREAVLDGYLVDYEPPHIIQTKLSKEGIKWKKGEKVEYYDAEQMDIKQLELLEDELNFDIADFNKKVLTRSFNQVVIDYLVKNIDPDSDEKTLIFAANNLHADMIISLLKEKFTALNDDAIIKITASVDNVKEQIRRLKNERLPNIVVTVDLLTTGIDVPEICNLVFMRRVSSRILYEQMIGRATRKCDRIQKDHFEIYDAVGIYEILKLYTQMKPIVQNPKTDISKLIDELSNIGNERQQRIQIETIIAKLQRKKNIVRDEHEEKFKTKTKGNNISNFIKEFKDMNLKEQVQFAKKNKDIFEFFDTIRPLKEKQYISDHDDQITSVKRNFNSKDAGDYIKDFEKYIKENQNKIAALKTVLQKPKDLTRKSLKELLLQLDEKGYTLTNLKRAWKDYKTEEMASSIIGLIRRLALGDPLIPHEERVKQAIEKIKNSKDWSKQQLNWIERIGEQVIKEIVLDKEAFSYEPFKSHGGYERINKILDNQLNSIIENIYDYMYSPQAK